MTDQEAGMSEARDELNDDDVLATTYEEDMELIDKRLKRLYPNVDFEKTQVPTQWNREDRCAFMLVSHLNLRFAYPDRPGNGSKGKLEPGAIRANHPCPIFAGIYYFEVHILESNGFMGIGLCQRAVKMNRLPGWDPMSYGYHGDDGNFFSASGNGTSYGPKYGTGDVIGCGLNLVRRTVFFTKNGENIGTAMTIMDGIDELFPTVGLQTPKATVDVNFGQKQFVYDIYKDIQDMKDALKHQINEMRMPMNHKRSWLNQYVASWLATEGHADTLTAFCKESKTKYSEIEEGNVMKRKELAKLIHAGKVTELYEDLNQKYSNLKDARALSLDLRIQRFAENMKKKLSLMPAESEQAGKNGYAKEGNGCAAEPKNPFKVPRSTNGKCKVATSSAEPAAGSNSAASSSVQQPQPSSSGLGTSSAAAAESVKQDAPSSSSSMSPGEKPRGGTGMTMSPSRPHKRRSSGVKVADGEKRDSSSSRPPSSDMGPPPRRRSAKGKEEERMKEEEEKMEVDIPEDLMKRVMISTGPVEIIKEPDAAAAGGAPSSSSTAGPSTSSKNGEGEGGGGGSRERLRLTGEEYNLLVEKAIEAKDRLSRSTSRSKAGGGEGKKRTGWGGTEIVEEGKSGDCDLKQLEEDRKLRCGYSKETEERARALYDEQMEEGMEIGKEMKVLKKKYPAIGRYATMALSTIMCESREEIEAHPIFGEKRILHLVHSMNEGLIELEYGPQLATSKLARLEDCARKDKIYLMKRASPTAAFIDIEGMLGRAEDVGLRGKQQKCTTSFYDPDHLRLLERRRKQAELDRRMREKEKKLELKKKLEEEVKRKKEERREERKKEKEEKKEEKKKEKEEKKKKREKEDVEMGEKEEGVGEKKEGKKKKKKKKKRKEGDEKPPVLSEEQPMEIEGEEEGKKEREMPPLDRPFPPPPPPRASGGRMVVGPDGRRREEMPYERTARLLRFGEDPVRAARNARAHSAAIAEERRRLAAARAAVEERRGEGGGARGGRQQRPRAERQRRRVEGGEGAGRERGDGREGGGERGDGREGGSAGF